MQAKKLQNMIGWPSTKNILGYIKNKIIYNFPVTRSNILATEDIFVCGVGYLKGKTNRSNPFIVHGLVINIPARIVERYKNVILSADIMQANKILFIITI